jgi:hypothetical protein
MSPQTETERPISRPASMVVLIILRIEGWRGW